MEMSEDKIRVPGPVLSSRRRHCSSLQKWSLLVNYAAMLFGIAQVNSVILINWL